MTCERGETALVLHYTIPDEAISPSISNGKGKNHHIKAFPRPYKADMS